MAKRNTTTTRRRRAAATSGIDPATHQAALDRIDALEHAAAQQPRTAIEAPDPALAEASGVQQGGGGHIDPPNPFDQGDPRTWGGGSRPRD